MTFYKVFLLIIILFLFFSPVHALTIELSEQVDCGNVLHVMGCYHHEPPRIVLRADLNPHLMILVFLHEYAHHLGIMDEDIAWEFALWADGLRMGVDFQYPNRSLFLDKLNNGKNI